MIRPFQIGDLLLVQRLGRQACGLNEVQSLLEPQSSFWSLFFSYLPWNHAKVVTYILRQEGHGLLGDGFLQTRKRQDRPEADILHLAPALGSEWGHPAIWEKLLTHYNRTAAQQKIERIYADVPDQPLPVTTFHRAGFRVYTRQTVWRLPAHRIDDYAEAISAHIRPQRDSDRWALTRLYTQTVPKPVQLAEGATGERHGPPPILRPPHRARTCATYVLEGENKTHGRVNGEMLEHIQGVIQIVEGKRGYWFSLWADTNNPNPYVVHELLRYGVSILHRWGGWKPGRKPAYIGVYDYQAGLNAILADYGFAPVTDRARMVRHLTHWVRDMQAVMNQAMESVPQIPIAPFDSSTFQSRALQLCATQALCATQTGRAASAHREDDRTGIREEGSREGDREQRSVFLAMRSEGLDNGRRLPRSIRFLRFCTGTGKYNSNDRRTEPPQPVGPFG